MFSKDTCFRIGFISKLHGYKGEVIFQFESENPQEFSQLESVFVEYDTKLIPFFLSEIHLKHKGSAIVKLEDIDSEKKAQLLVGCNLYLPIDDETEDETRKQVPELEGFTLIDSNEGEVGKIIRTVNLNGNQLLEVQADHAEVLIPKQASWIDRIDTASKKIYMTLPTGLLNLNSEKSKMSANFHFKNFSIQQIANAQKVGTDSMLLGAWTDGRFSHILDVGTGTGILALMMAQKNQNAKIIAIEPDIDSSKEANYNFSNSTYKSQITSMTCSLQDFKTSLKFDLIITNPPYFQNGFLSQDDNKNRARHNEFLPTQILYKKTLELLSNEGKINVIVPYNIEQFHLDEAQKNGLYANRILHTKRQTGEFKRSLISFSKNKTSTKFEEMIVKNELNEYSSDYIEMTKDFYAKDLTINLK